MTFQCDDAPMKRHPDRPRSRCGLALLRVFMVCAVMEAVSYTVIGVYNATSRNPIVRNAVFFERNGDLIRQFLNSKESREVWDPVLGWRPRAGLSGPQDDISAQGIRAERLYAPLPARGVTRVAAFGDSFVYGNEVTTRESWARRLEVLDPRLEVLNYGVSAYGVDQAYLRYLREGTQFAPRIILIGFVEYDLRRLVNVCRCFMSHGEMPLIKPRFIFNHAGELRLLANPASSRSDLQRFAHDPRLLRTLGANDRWYQPLIYENPLYDVSATVRLLTTLSLRLYQEHLDPDRWMQRPSRVFAPGVREWRVRRSSEAYRLQVAIFDAFASAVRAANAVPVIVVFPSAGAIRGRFHHVPPAYTPLVRDMRSRGVAVMDLAEAFREFGNVASVDSYFTSGGHYSSTGNEIVARWIAQRTPGILGEPSGRIP